MAPPHAVRLLAEGRWEELLSSGAADQDDALDLLRTAAAIELKRWDDALRHSGAALRLRPRDSTLFFYRGVALAGKGDRAGAAAAWQEALKHKPADWPLQAELVRRQVELK
ncbi:MAG: hypothetical protein HY293_07710 [Planctomycetes bacterium]|nr:hypothetical protein [Planctomycetota bacterium]